MTLRISSRGPKSKRFQDQQGVTVSVKDYGSTGSAPFYEPMYEALEAVGYVRDRDIRVAGYDSRLTPDMWHFVDRAKELIVDTYRDSGRHPVHLVGHSNGPLYAQYLLTHTSRKWKNRYIHGFTPIAGNFPGQGLLYPLFFTGLNITDFTFPTTAENAASSALMYLSAPSSYMALPTSGSSTAPRLSADLTGCGYTQTTTDLFEDAACRAKRSPIATSTPSPRPAFLDSEGSDDAVGMLPTTVGQVVDESNEFATRRRRRQPEDITNDAVLAKRHACFHSAHR
jgi:lysophospholipase-3